MSFNKEDCYVKKVWCGNGSKPNSKKYTKNGTRYECLKQGFGAGKYTEKRSNLPATSLQQISYIGDKHEKSLKRKGISTTTELVKTMRSMKVEEKEVFLKKTLKSGRKHDGRAYNNVLLFLYAKGVRRLPTCTKL